MNEQNRDHFENEWAKAFEGASMQPSDHVWDKIELAVANADNSSTKKRLFFFKLLAAASISFAAIIGGWQVFDAYYSYQDSNILAKEEIKNADNSSKSGQESNNPISKLNSDGTNDETIEKGVDSPLAEINNNNEDNSLNDEIEKSNESETNNQSFKRDSDNDPVNFSLLAAAENDEDNSVNVNVKDLVTDKNNALLGQQGDLSDNNSLWAKLERLAGYLEVDLATDQPELEMVPWLAFNNNSNKDKNNETSGLWTGLGMSTGTFNPNGISSSSNDAALFSNDALDASGAPSFNRAFVGEEEAGSSFGIGLNLGTTISKKVVLVTGLSYLQQNTSSFSNIVQAEQGTTRVLSSAEDVNSFSNVQFTDTYEVSSTYQTLSIPVQAGYYVLNRKFDILLMAGFSNDFFIRRNVTDETGMASGESFSAADEGYSLYTIGGLLGTQLSYQIGDHYIIAVQPQFRQSINSFTPEGNRPSALEVGFKLNYILK